MNVRTPEVMERVQAEVETHYRSILVENLRKQGGVLTVGKTTIRLAKDFGFCYGVERAIDLAYAARKVFADRKVYLLGEIIHNPEVNEQIHALGVRNLLGKNPEADVDNLTAEDVVIVPAFGTDVATLARLTGAFAGAGGMALIGMGPAYAVVTAIYVAATLLSLGIAPAPPAAMQMPVLTSSKIRITPWRVQISRTAAR